ncbi:YdcF family protein [Hazenella coriacea]|uniref:Uncharacterized SAM-binding protein YcdF (DUF218 family) n=1 Tax=Hazenella coriacea TaxID=1179467 RepID=A0A4R3L8P0_9BACL|nr:YdcF family protein [Hazenella coriacea]TCS95952.1 uncharacterized SAM-binding protein YcdF (DUF218 family) [Hazenella coriacea]
MKQWLIIGSIPVIGLLIILITFWSLTSRYDDLMPDSKHHQAAIVLGAALWDDEPSPALKERLNTALVLYQNQTVDILILSGGLGNDGITEAEGMKNYLVSKGVSEEDLILETGSHNTQENLAHSAKLLEAQQIHDVVLVTHDYHMYRALEYAHRAGISATPAPTHSTVLFMPYHKARECLAILKLKIWHE